MLGHSLQGAGLTIDGVELNPTWAEMARPYYRDVWASTIEAAPLPDKTYKLIVCADVLEHTADPVAVLRRLRRAGADDAVFIVSVPNVAHLAVRMMLLFGLFPKMERGPLDRTHLHFFTRGRPATWSSRRACASAGSPAPACRWTRSGRAARGACSTSAAIKAQHARPGAAAAAVRLPVDPGGAGVRGRSRAALYRRAAAAVGGAIQFYDGEYQPGPGGAAAIGLITFAIVASALGVARGLGAGGHPASPPGCPARRARERLGEGAGEGLLDRPPAAVRPLPITVPRDGGQNGSPDRLATGILAVLLAIQLTILLTHRPDSPEHSYLFPDGLAGLGYYRAGLAAAAVAGRLRCLTALRPNSRTAPPGSGSRRPARLRPARRAWCSPGRPGPASDTRPAHRRLRLSAAGRPRPAPRPQPLRHRATTPTSITAARSTR